MTNECSSASFNRIFKTHINTWQVNMIMRVQCLSLQGLFSVVLHHVHKDLLGYTATVWSERLQRKGEDCSDSRVSLFPTRRILHLIKCGTGFPTDSIVNQSLNIRLQSNEIFLQEVTPSC